MPPKNMPKKQAKASAKTESVKKWGDAVMKLGFTIVPSLLFKGQQRLGLSTTQLAVLLQLMDHWWHADQNPWPSKKLLSDKLGIQPRQVQRVVGELEKRGYVKRINRSLPLGGKTSNGYDLSGLVNALQKLAPDFQRVEDDTKSNRRKVVRKGYAQRGDKTPK